MNWNHFTKDDIIHKNVENFHIYVHGNRQLIEQGADEKGKYYKVYYQEES